MMSRASPYFLVLAALAIMLLATQAFAMVESVGQTEPAAKTDDFNQQVVDARAAPVWQQFTPTPSSGDYTQFTVAIGTGIEQSYAPKIIIYAGWAATIEFGQPRATTQVQIRGHPDGIVEATSGHLTDCAVAGIYCTCGNCKSANDVARTAPLGQQLTVKVGQHDEQTAKMADGAKTDHAYQFMDVVGPKVDGEKIEIQQQYPQTAKMTPHEPGATIVADTGGKQHIGRAPKATRTDEDYIVATARPTATIRAA